MAKYRKAYFFGTFNPIHNGHLMMAEYLLEHTDIGNIYFVVSPDAPFKDTNGELADMFARIRMISMAVWKPTTGGVFTKRMHACSIENGMPQPTYTANTLAAICKDKVHSLASKPVLVLGADNFIDLAHGKFYHSDEILKEYPIYVFPRDGYTDEAVFLAGNCNDEIEGCHVEVLVDAPTANLSSTFIRNEIKQGHDVRFYVPDEIVGEVKQQYG